MYDIIYCINSIDPVSFFLSLFFFVLALFLLHTLRSFGFRLIPFVLCHFAHTGKNNRDFQFTCVPIDLYSFSQFIHSIQRDHCVVFVIVGIVFVSQRNQDVAKHLHCARMPCNENEYLVQSTIHTLTIFSIRIHLTARRYNFFFTSTLSSCSFFFLTVSWASRLYLKCARNKKNNNKKCFSFFFFCFFYVQISI